MSMLPGARKATCGQRWHQRHALDGKREPFEALLLAPLVRRPRLATAH